MKLDSDYIRIVDFPGYNSNVIAIKDFEITYEVKGEIKSFEIHKGDRGGYISCGSEIVGKTWIGRYSSIMGSTVIDSLIGPDSLIINSNIKESAIMNSNVWFSDVDYSDIYLFSKVINSNLSRSNVCESHINSCLLKNSNARLSILSESSFHNVNATRCSLTNIDLPNKEVLTITKDNTIVFKNFWSSGRYFLYHIPTKRWYVGCFTGNSEELLRKALADSEEKYEMYKKYVDFVQNLIPT